MEEVVCNANTTAEQLRAVQSERSAPLRIYPRLRTFPPGIILQFFRSLRSADLDLMVLKMGKSPPVLSSRSVPTTSPGPVNFPILAYSQIVGQPDVKRAL